jgi:predicted DsbA family dithiol-disulfide isomerase
MGTDHLPRRMDTAAARFHFDFVDPFSWLMSRVLEDLPDADPARGGAPTPDIEWVGFERRPPPVPMLDGDDPETALERREAQTLAETFGLKLNPPWLVPWTRKAHELALHADSTGGGRRVRAAVFEAYFSDGLDIGRVDVLVEIARQSGFDAGEAKAVLDVDRYESGVAGARQAALLRGITSTPLFEFGGVTLAGFHNEAVVRTFLGT